MENNSEQKSVNDRNKRRQQHITIEAVIGNNESLQIDNNYNTERTDRTDDKVNSMIITLQPLNINKTLNPDHVTTCHITNIPIAGSLITRSWMKRLINYPNKTWSYRLIHDIIYGVNIGYAGPR